MKGSAAAGIMSSYGGSVAAGSFYAIAQSIRVIGGLDCRVS